jgi:hypothetical protein
MASVGKPSGGMPSRAARLAVRARWKIGRLPAIQLSDLPTPHLQTATTAASGSSCSWVM